MKRKFLLSTIIFPTIAISPFLYSCNKIKDYKVNQSEFEKAIKLENVKFLQADSYQYVRGEFYEREKCDFSEDIYHEIYISSDYYYEVYVIKHVGAETTYTKFERDNPNDNFSDEEPAYSYEFKTIESVRDRLWAYYIISGGYNDLSFDEDKKCYVGTATPNAWLKDFEFYFLNKKLVKFGYGDDYSWNEDTLEYKSVVPTPPSAK